MNTDTTFNRILNAAIEIFLKQGVRQTNLTEVAHAAGVTRVTVYRYFSDKKGLVEAVCITIAAVFQRAIESAPVQSLHELDERVNRLGQELSALPQGNLLAMLEEISRIYPDVYEDYQIRRQNAVDSLFQMAVETAAQEGLLREGLNLDVLKAIFWSSVVGLVENPALVSSNVPLSEIYSTVSVVFRYGFLKSETKENHS
jgi:AcrR family transcriptional regulator